MNELTLRILDSGQVLERVLCYFLEVESAAMVVALELQFSEASLVVSSSDADEIRVSASLDELLLEDPALGEISYKSVDISAQTDWAEAVGRRLLWARDVVNHQGYLDGLQVQFTTPDCTDNGPEFQVVCIASFLKLSSLVPTVWRHAVSAR